mgnify:CR=1 FL=1
MCKGGKPWPVQGGMQYLACVESCAATPRPAKVEAAAPTLRAEEPPTSDIAAPFWGQCSATRGLIMVKLAKKLFRSVVLHLSGCAVTRWCR